MIALSRRLDVVHLVVGCKVLERLVCLLGVVRLQTNWLQKDDRQLAVAARVSGTRLTLTILHELRRRGLRYGIVTMCIGGGMGAAALLESA
jgi:hypothetical protein